MSVEFDAKSTASRFWLLLILATLCNFPSFGDERISTVTIDGEKIKGITRASLRPDGRVMIIFDGGGRQYPAEKFSQEFLSSWSISLDKVSAAKEDDFENAVRTGKFRVVDGVVYDLRQPQPSWTYFQNVKLIQKVEAGGALVEPYPDQILEIYRQTGGVPVIHVSNLPNIISDTERFSFSAKQVGTYSYINKREDDRVVRSYDFGRVCERSEIPDAILKEGKPFAEITSAAVQRSILSDLPQTEDLLQNGTGFFITEDGYLITNDHVVRGVRRVKVRLQTRVYDAEIVKTDRDADLALLKVDGGVFPALPVVMQKESSLGDAVFTIGFPNVELQGIEPKYTDGRISSLAGLHDDPSQYQVSVPVQPGNSGGPLLDDNGQVVGVVVARINDFAVLRDSGTIPQNVNYAIKASALREFLKPIRELAGKLKMSNPGNLNRAAAIKESQAGTVIVLGYR